MNNNYMSGYAFILEGDTEKEFYLTLLNHLCEKHMTRLERVVNQELPDIVYELKTNIKQAIVKFDIVNSITQIPYISNWIQISCIKEYGPQCGWHIFLCYDTEDYKADISKFNEGDWKRLRSDLKKASQILDIIDIAASADIEDIMLEDIDSVCAYLGCNKPEPLKGRKGKVKMKNLFRENGKFYHEGKRAGDLIAALDMDYLIKFSELPLQKIENIIFE